MLEFSFVGVPSLQLEVSGHRSWDQSTTAWSLSSVSLGMWTPDSVVLAFVRCVNSSYRSGVYGHTRSHALFFTHTDICQKRGPCFPAHLLVAAVLSQGPLVCLFQPLSLFPSRVNTGFLQLFKCSLTSPMCLGTTVTSQCSQTRTWPWEKISSTTNSLCPHIHTGRQQTAVTLRTRFFAE